MLSTKMPEEEFRGLPQYKRCNCHRVSIRSRRVKRSFQAWSQGAGSVAADSGCIRECGCPSMYPRRPLGMLHRPLRSTGKMLACVEKESWGQDSKHDGTVQRRAKFNRYGVSEARRQSRFERQARNAAKTNLIPGADPPSDTSFALALLSDETTRHPIACVFNSRLRMLYTCLPLSFGRLS